ncbi:DUF2149 domain-containing protein [Comamonas sp. GB3 AK4-5]|uniref:DUF2149 domain-containing protein n=1 Tax=Comamonas sp. GB3 AK4-5 TaxID=3231487 RepID=UPI00351F40D6
MKFLQETDSDDPMLSVVNLIDIFLVIIAALLITIAQNPLMAAMAKQDVTVVTDAGKDGMEMLVKKGDKIERFKANGQTGEGEGAKAGVAYRMKDGSVVYVPESTEAAAGETALTAP